jgi:hypothetical protein
MPIRNLEDTPPTFRFDYKMVSLDLISTLADKKKKSIIIIATFYFHKNKGGGVERMLVHGAGVYVPGTVYKSIRS